jgi:hypothetical protein
VYGLVSCPQHSLALSFAATFATQFFSDDSVYGYKFRLVHQPKLIKKAGLVVCWFFALLVGRGKRHIENVLELQSIFLYDTTRKIVSNIGYFQVSSHLPLILICSDKKSRAMHVKSKKHLSENREINKIIV